MECLYISQSTSPNQWLLNVSCYSKVVMGDAPTLPNHCKGSADCREVTTLSQDFILKLVILQV